MPIDILKHGACTVAGEQAINRAEVFAVGTCVQHVATANIYTDSRYACKSVHLCRTSANLMALTRHDIFDCLRFLHARDQQQHRVIKVKAHECIRSVSCPLARYHALGDQMANDEAIPACTSLNPPWAT